MNLIEQKWEEIKLYLKNEYALSAISYETWIRPLKLYKVEGDLVTIEVPNDNIFRNYVRNRHYNTLRCSINECINDGTNYDIIFITSAEAEKAKPVINTPSENENEEKLFKQANLNPKYTFDTFVVGKNNSFAHAAAVAAAENPGTQYNPLFIYGGPGLGKTHLMHSIAHYILKNNKDSKILYVTSEEFTYELIEAIRSNSSMTKFREKYRNIDVLLIDDIQFIIGKESTQEEFFHTFNTLHGAKKQIIITSDKPPKDMNILEERIRSRFEWGLIADISSPDYETRMAILRKKEELDGYHVNENVIQYIAENVKSNIRELEGSLNKVMAYANLEHKEVTIELAEEVLKDLISPNQKKEVTPELILSIVAEHYNLTVDDLTGRRRNATVVLPRQISMYLCREMTQLQLNNIGKYIGNRDHTTVMHGIEKIEVEIEQDISLSNTIKALKKKINPQI